MFLLIFTFSERFWLFSGGFSLRDPYFQIPDRSQSRILKDYEPGKDISRLADLRRCHTRQFFLANRNA